MGILEKVPVLTSAIDTLAGLFSACKVHEAAPPALPRIKNPDIARIRERILSELYDGAIDAGALLRDLQKDGSFTSIDYETDRRDTWHPAKHLEYILLMQKSCYSPDHPQYLKKELMEGINRALRYWSEQNFVCEWNGWWNGLGTNITLGNILMFPNTGANQAVLDNLFSKLDGPSITHESKPLSVRERAVESTGGNLTDKVLSSLKSAVVREDGSEILFLTGLMENELRPFPSKKPFSHRYDVEGIKADMSFQQHYELLYLGGYGEVFCDGMNAYLRYTQGTQFALSPAARNAYAAFILDGMQYAMRGKYRDINASGRGIARKGELIGIQTQVLDACNALLLDDDIQRSGELAALLKNRTGQRDPGAGGFRYFWCSDYGVYNGEHYMASVRAASKRTKNSEALNGENILGHYLGAGATMYYLDGSEYFNSLPLWNWNKVPGTTARQGFLPVGGDETYGRMGKTTFVGGAGNDRGGVSCMDHDDNGVKARKAWFFLENGVVCLGAGIESSKKEPVYTCINQTLTGEDGAQYCTGGRVLPLTRYRGKADWVLNNRIGYVAKNEVACVSEQREGDWRAISDRLASTPQSGAMLELGIDHGIKPNGATYDYTVLLGATAEQLTAYVRNPEYITLKNERGLQAVWDTKNAALYAVFYQRGEIATPAGDVLAVNKGTVLTYTSNALIVGNPKQQPVNITVRINGKPHTISCEKGVNSGKAKQLSL